jgi:hypothetical protein
VKDKFVVSFKIKLVYVGVVAKFKEWWEYLLNTYVGCCQVEEWGKVVWGNSLFPIIVCQAPHCLVYQDAMKKSDNLSF